MNPQILALTRRQFGLSMGGALFAKPGETLPWQGPATLKRVYVGTDNITWPRHDLDIQKAKAEVEAALADVQRRHSDAVKLTGGELVVNPAEASAWLAQVGDVDGILIIPLTSKTDGLILQIGKKNLPTLLFLRPWAGHSWASFSPWAQQGNRADVLASSEFADLDLYMRIFHTIGRVRRSKVIVSPPTPGGKTFAASLREQFGTSFEFMTYPEVKAAYEAADARQAGNEADAFMKGALKVVEPGREQLADAMRMYLGIRNLMERQKANAITIECLGALNRGDLPALPCAAWTKLNDEGLYGVCQADLQCTMTQLLLTPFSGKPGFVSNPVFETTRNEIIHSHCVAPTRMMGVNGVASPYIIRSHADTDRSVSIQVLMPVGENVTVGKFLDARTFLLSTGEVVGNVDSPPGCRTQIRTRVRNAQAFLDNNRGGVHRVVYYGDYVRPIERMARLLGFKVIREDA